MDLAYLTSIYPRATDTFVRNEVQELRRRGNRVETFSIRRTDPEQLVGPEIREEAERTTVLFSDHIRESPLSALKLLARSPARFARALKLAWQTRPPGLKALVWQIAYFLEASLLADRLLRQEIRHLHNHIGENSATVAMLASELSGIPYSMTIHGPYIFRAPERWALREKIVRSAFTACITEFARSQCMIHVPYSEWDRMHVIRCGPERSFLEREAPPNDGPRRFVWVGRFCEEKAVPLLIAALDELRTRGEALELTMVGDGPLRPTIEQQIAARGLEAFVTLTGWLDSEQVRERIVDSRALVAPSFAEGLPIVVMEALALKRPVISTYLAGIPELVEPGQNGWLIPAGSRDALADAMQEALALPIDRLRAMGEAGRESVLRHHDPRVEIARLEALMHERKPRSGAGEALQ